MDQFASAVSREGHALLLDCRSLETRPVPVPEQATVVVMDTGARRSLAGSAYNDRRAACERVVAHLRTLDPSVRALRDVGLDLLERGEAGLDPTDLKRARHVVPENQRPVLMESALEKGDLAGAGRLMNDSHSSLRDLYEVSCEELELDHGDRPATALVLRGTNDRGGLRGVCRGPGGGGLIAGVL